MPALILLGIIFVTGLFIYYLASTRAETKPDDDRTDEELKQEENVIFLPNDIERVKRKQKNQKK